MAPDATNGIPAADAAASSPGAEAGELLVGYQRFGGLSLVKARGETPGVTWSLFESGPALTEALRAGAIDIGQVGERRRSSPPPEKSSSGSSVRQNRCRGRGGAGQGVPGFPQLRRPAREDGGLKPAEARPAFDNDQVDAWIIWDPYFALAEQPGVEILADAAGLASNREYILVSPEALERKPDQIRKFLQTYRSTTDWGIANPGERTGWRLARDGTLGVHLLDSLTRAGIGLAIGGLLALLLGGTAGLLRLGDDLVDPPVQMARMLPHLGLVPLLIIWVGIGESLKITLVALGGFFPIYFNTYAGIRDIDERLVEAARTCGLGQLARIRTSYCPAPCRRSSSGCGWPAAPPG